MRQWIGRGVLALAMIGALSAAGCGKTVIPKSKAEDFVRSHVSNPQSVSCPSDTEAKVGTHFDCSVTTSDGKQETVTVDITSVQGTTVGLQITRPPSQGGGTDTNPTSTSP